MRLFDPNDDLYIWITGWKEFQHYRPDPARGPAWIKAYTAQLDDERYLALTDRQRALLWDLRMIFAAMRCRVPCGAPTNVRRRSDDLPDDAPTTLRRRSGGAPTITRQRGLQTRGDDLDALNHAGLIEFVSRDTLEQRLDELYSGSRVARAGAPSQEEEEEKKNPPSPPKGGRPLTRRDLRPYTGCQATRGSHGASHRHTTLGTDKPPSDWPHPKPDERELRAALARQWIDQAGWREDDQAVRDKLNDHFGVNGDDELELRDRAAERRAEAGAA